MRLTGRSHLSACAKRAGTALLARSNCVLRIAIITEIAQATANAHAMRAGLAMHARQKLVRKTAMVTEHAKPACAAARRVSKRHPASLHRALMTVLVTGNVTRVCATAADRSEATTALPKIVLSSVAPGTATAVTKVSARASLALLGKVVSARFLTAPATAMGTELVTQSRVVVFATPPLMGMRCTPELVVSRSCAHSDVRTMASASTAYASAKKAFQAPVACSACARKIVPTTGCAKMACAHVPLVLKEMTAPRLNRATAALPLARWHVKFSACARRNQKKTKKRNLKCTHHVRTAATELALKK